MSETAELLEVKRLQSELEEARAEVVRLREEAAALCEALQIARGWMPSVHRYFRDGQPFKRDLAIIDNAIAKATGVQYEQD